MNRQKRSDALSLGLSPVDLVAEKPRYIAIFVLTEENRKISRVAGGEGGI